MATGALPNSSTKCWSRASPLLRSLMSSQQMESYSQSPERSSRGSTHGKLVESAVSDHVRQPLACYGDWNRVRQLNAPRDVLPPLIPSSFDSRKTSCAVQEHPWRSQLSDDVATHKRSCEPLSPPHSPAQSTGQGQKRREVGPRDACDAAPSRRTAASPTGPF